EAARDSLWERRRDVAGGSAEPPVLERRPTNADALVALADTALAREDARRSGGERYQVVMHVDASALSGDGPGDCGLEGGPAVAPETARRLACDSALVRVADVDDKVLS